MWEERRFFPLDLVKQMREAISISSVEAAAEGAAGPEPNQEPPAIASSLEQIGHQTRDTGDPRFSGVKTVGDSPMNSPMNSPMKTVGDTSHSPIEYLSAP